MDAKGIEAKVVVPASRKLGRDEASKLARDAKRIIVAKGKRLTEIAGGRATESTIEAMLGPTGNLRAPLIRSGKTVLVGFNEEAYEEALG